MRPTAIPIVVILVLFLAALAGPAAAGPWQGQVESEGGVRHVRNPAAPIEEARTIAPRELWRLGGENEADEEIFGFVDAILVDEAGEIFILDGQLSEIRVFSPEGEFLRTLGTEGEGPGEFRNANSAFFLSDGRIGVVQMMPARIAVLGKGGEAHGDLLLPGSGGMRIVERARSLGGRVLLGILNPSFEDSKVVMNQTLVPLGADGAYGDAILEQSEEQSGAGGIRMTGGRQEDFSRHWEPGKGGRIYVAPRYSRYEIIVLGPDGGTESVISRDYERLERSKEEIEEMREAMSGGSGGFGNIEVEVAPFARDIVSLLPREDGELWGVSGRGEKDCPESTIGLFDVFDGQGRFAHQLGIRADYDGRYDDYIVSTGRLFVIKEAKSGPDRVSSSGSGQGETMMMIRRSGATSEDEDEREAGPIEIICYELDA